MKKPLPGLRLRKQEADSGRMIQEAGRVRCKRIGSARRSLMIRPMIKLSCQLAVLAPVQADACCRSGWIAHAIH